MKPFHVKIDQAENGYIVWDHSVMIQSTNWHGQSFIAKDAVDLAKLIHELAEQHKLNHQYGKEFNVKAIKNE